MSVKYSIRVEKDGVNVRARYDIRIPIGTTEILASFELNVEGKNLIGTFSAAKGVYGHKVLYPDEPLGRCPRFIRNQHE
jgi:hypothetical protein